jgi:conjugal transfer pilus assembly protein TraE
MKMPWQKTTWENAIKSNTALSLSNVVLAIIAFLAVAHALGLKDRVVLTPPVVTKEMTVGWSSADAEYLKSFGLYATTLIGNITPANSDFVVGAISNFMDSSIYTEAKKHILSASQSRTFFDSAASSKFTPRATYYEADTSTVFVSGDMAILSAGSQPQIGQITYEMKIIIRGGKPVIMSLTSYDGLEPHDSAWKEKHKNDAPVNNANGVKK